MDRFDYLSALQKLKVRLDEEGVDCAKCGDRYLPEQVSKFAVGMVCRSCVHERDRQRQQAFDRWAELRVPKRFEDPYTKRHDGADARALNWRGSPELLTIHGDAGIGKTHLAAAVLHAQHGSGGFVKAADFGEMDIIERKRLRGLRCLVIDDFGYGHRWQDQGNLVSAAISERWDDRRLTIITTRLTLAELTSDASVADRVAAGVLVHLKGDSRR